MKNEQTTQVSKFYSEWVNMYDVQVKKTNQQLDKLLINFYKENNFISGTILDLGCETGRIGKKLTNFPLTGIEGSKEMAKIAKNNTKR